MGKERRIGAPDYLAYVCSSIVYLLPQCLMSSYMSAYYTDVVLVSAGTVGVVVLIMRFTDGVSDLMMGRLIDRTNSRWGKARPWLLVGSLGLTVTLITVFHVPASFSASAKIIWLAVTYFLLMTVFSTVQGVSANTMIIYMTDDPKQRTMFGASNMAGVYIGNILATTVTAVLLGVFGYTQGGYDKTILCYSVLVLFCGIFSFARLRETQTLGITKVQEKRVPMKQILVSMVQNKYYVSAVISGLLINVNTGVTAGLGIYFCRDLFGDASLYVLVTIVLLLPTLVGLPICVIIAKKWGDHKTLMYGRVIYLVGLILVAVGIMTTNAPILLMGNVICGIGNATFAACFTARVANVCDYGEWKYQLHATGTMMSATSVCNKMGLGLGSVITGLVLEFAKYDGAAAAAGIAQSGYTVMVERLSIAFLPLVLNIFITIFMYLSNVDPEMKTVREELQERRKMS